MATTGREERLNGYQQLSRQADEALSSGDRERAVQLLTEGRDRATQAGDGDYRLFFEAELLGCADADSRDYDRRIELVERAMRWTREHGFAEDGLLMRTAGAYQYMRGQLDEAITWFDKALAVNPRDYDAMRNKGVSLSKKGQEDEAITWFDKALAVNPRDYDAMRDKGVSLSKKGQEDEAITWFDKALEVNPHDYDAMRQKGVSLSEKGEQDEAITWLKRALEFPEARKDGYAFYALAVACRRAGRIEDAVQALAGILEKPEEFPTVAPLARRLNVLIQADLPEKSLSSKDRVVLEARRPEYAIGPEERIRAKIEAAEQTAYDDYMERKSSERDNVVSVLRGWSSAVTLLEGTEQLWRGGGYFVKWAGKGIVIDPGFDFLRNFHDEGYHAREIAAVLVSHNHSDHNADLKSVDDLRYELYKRRGKDEAKRVDPYVLIWDADTQASTRFSMEEPKHQFKPALFDVGRCDPCDTIDKPHSLPMSVEYFPVRHKVGVRDPVGFKLRLLGAADSSFTLGYTGDTEFFPELADRLSECNLLIAHISQPDPDEFSNPSVRKQNHLGYRGLVDLIKACNPETTIVSEFWAGLADIRIDLVQAIRRLTDTRSILPGGIGMHVHIPGLQVECTQCARKVPFVDVRVSPPATQFGHLAYLCSECVLG